MHCFFGTIIGAKSKHVYRQMLNITRNMGCTHLARAEPLFSVSIIRRDTQFLIWPLGRVEIRKVTQHSIELCQKCQRIQNHMVALKNSAWITWDLISCGNCLYRGSMCAPPPARRTPQALAAHGQRPLKRWPSM